MGSNASAARARTASSAPSSASSAWTAASSDRRRSAREVLDGARGLVRPQPACLDRQLGDVGRGRGRVEQRDEALQQLRGLPTMTAALVQAGERAQRPPVTGLDVEEPAQGIGGERRVLQRSFGQLGEAAQALHAGLASVEAGLPVEHLGQAHPVTALAVDGLERDEGLERVAVAAREALPGAQRGVGRLERPGVEARGGGLQVALEFLRQRRAQLEQLLVGGDQVLLEVPRRREALHLRARARVLRVLAHEPQPPGEGLRQVAQLLVQRGQLGAERPGTREVGHARQHLQHRRALRPLCRRGKDGGEQLRGGLAHARVGDEGHQVRHGARLVHRPLQDVGVDLHGALDLAGRRQRPRPLDEAVDVRLLVSGLERELAQPRQGLGALEVATRGAQHALERDERLGGARDGEEIRQRGDALAGAGLGGQLRLEQLHDARVVAQRIERGRHQLGGRGLRRAGRRRELRQGRHRLRVAGGERQHLAQQLERARVVLGRRELEPREPQGQRHPL